MAEGNRKRSTMNNVNDIEQRASEVNPLALFAASAQIFADKISTVRSIMGSRHGSQRVVLINPEFPIVFTGAENVFGKRSSWNIVVDKKSNDPYEVMKVIRKFKEVKDSPVCYILRNINTGKFKAIVLKPVVNLTEKYGFRMEHNFEKQHIKVGDIVPADFTVSQSSSYVNDNYCAGRNIRMAYVVLPDVTEDALIISDYAAEVLKYNMVDKVEFEISKDAFLLNNYGDTTTYKPFPDIGERIRNNTICSIRENSFISSVTESRIPHIIDKNIYSNGIVVDIDIFTNVEVENERFNFYLNQIREYYQEIFDYIHPIVSQDPTQDEINLTDIYEQAQKFLNTSTWVTKESIVDTLMRFWVLQPKDIHIGQKVVGRYGNKSVIAKIIPRHLMPKTDDGRPIDMLCNALSVPNRIISFATYESTMTFQAERLHQHIINMANNGATHDEIMDLVIRFESIYKPSFAQEAERLYRDDPDRMIRDILNNGIRIYIPPLSDVNIRDAILKADEEFKDIFKPYKVYTKLRHRWVELEGEYKVGYQYTWVLKQEPSKALSAISTGRTTNYDLPVKTKRYNKHLRHYSDNPVKFGEYDSYNLLIGVPAKDFAKITTYFRGSQYEENSVLMSQLNNMGIDLTKYNKFPQLCNLKNHLKLLGMRMRPTQYSYESIGGLIDQEEEVRFNNVKAKISLPDLSYCLMIHSYYLQYEAYLNGGVDMADFLDKIAQTTIFSKGVPDWYVEHVFNKFIEILPLLQQLKQY